MTSAAQPTLRAATAADVDAIATVWHDAWRDGHIGQVPDALLPHRRLQHFRERVPPRIAGTTVAVVASRIVGFATVHDHELEQLFVAAEARGGATARELLKHAEQAIAARHPTAWLAVATGNARARRFYERHGWRDASAIEYAAEIRGGTIPVACRRYEKGL